MIGAVQRENLRLPADADGELERGFDGLPSSWAEEGLCEPGWSDLRHLACEVDDGDAVVREEGRGEEAQLPADLLGKAGMAVTYHRGPVRARDRVEVEVPLGVPQSRALSPFEDETPVTAQRMQDVAVGVGPEVATAHSDTAGSSWRLAAYAARRRRDASEIAGAGSRSDVPISTPR